MMDANVSAKVARADEFPVADVAFIRFFSSVGKNVRLQISGRCKGLRALLTFVRTLPGMDTNVPSQIARTHKCFRAILALMRFLACVGQDMPL